jgi:hypothetical protein
LLFYSKSSSVLTRDDVLNEFQSKRNKKHQVNNPIGIDINPRKRLSHKAHLFLKQTPSNDARAIAEITTATEIINSGL